MSWHRTSSGRRPLLAVVLDPPPYRLEPAFILRLAFLPLRSRLNYSPALTPCSQHGFGIRPRSIRCNTPPPAPPPTWLRLRLQLCHRRLFRHALASDTASIALFLYLFSFSPFNKVTHLLTLTLGPKSPSCLYVCVAVQHRTWCKWMLPFALPTPHDASRGA